MLKVGSGKHSFQLGVYAEKRFLDKIAEFATLRGYKYNLLTLPVEFVLSRRNYMIGKFCFVSFHGNLFLITRIKANSVDLFGDTEKLIKKIFDTREVKQIEKNRWLNICCNSDALIKHKTVFEVKAFDIGIMRKSLSTDVARYERQETARKKILEKFENSGSGNEEIGITDNKPEKIKIEYDIRKLKVVKPAISNDDEYSDDYQDDRVVDIQEAEQSITFQAKPKATKNLKKVEPKIEIETEEPEEVEEDEYAGSIFK